MIKSSSRQTNRKSARTRHDNRKDAACERIQKYVTDESQSEAVAYVDNLLAPEIGNPALHLNPSLNVPTVYIYSGIPKQMTG